ncbi:kinase-like protein [Armillaria solidipes]|uniref:Kinase-like protein n=1 Tax=Armillaria solidipes TaxID=1076256 RepID=A0A2H3BE98_9AGAR|nr:kinase-like protein [Armillaria solidipes]
MLKPNHPSAYENSSGGTGKISFTSKVPLGNLAMKTKRLVPHFAVMPSSYHGPSTKSPLPPELIRALEPLPCDSYVKVGVMYNFCPEDLNKSAIWPLMIQEARVCEILMKYPHRNVVQYYGYAEKDGLMAGLCFKRYRQTLSDTVKKGTLPRADIESSLDQIKQGIEHIHGLGLVHNDINPRNILFDDDGRLVIIDFDSCRKQGESMLRGKCGTFPFSNDPETAEFQNDFYGVEKIREWMEENIPREID